MVILEFGEYLKTLLIVPLQLFVVAFHLLVILQSHIELVIQGRETVLFHIVLLLLLLQVALEVSLHVYDDLSLLLVEFLRLLVKALLELLDVLEELLFVILPLLVLLLMFKVLSFFISLQLLISLV